MSQYFVEWCSRPTRRGGVMTPLDSLQNLQESSDAGFRSVYAFSEEDSKAIRAAGNSQGFDRFEVYSDVLFIDLDDGEASLPAAEAWLKEQGLQCEIYSSGSKGFHLHVQILPMRGHGVPYSQLQFVRTLPFHADQSLYRHGSLIALPGRKHIKTGRKKELVKKLDGQKLRIEYQDPPARQPLPTGPITEVSALTKVFMRAEDLLLNPPQTGMRFNSMWLFARLCFEANVEPSTCTDLLERINEQWELQKEPGEIERAVRQGYRI